MISFIISAHASLKENTEANLGIFMHKCFLLFKKKSECIKKILPASADLELPPVTQVIFADILNELPSRHVRWSSPILKKRANFPALFRSSSSI